MHFNQSVANVNLIPESPTGASASALLSLPNDRSYSLRSFLESSSAHESLAHTHDAPSTFTTFSSYPSPHAPPPCLNNDSALSAGALSASRFLSSSICRIISAYASLFPLLFSPALATGVIVSAIAADAASATHAREDASAPRVVKIFVNAPSLSFENAATRRAAQVVELDGDDEVELDVTAFENVRVMTFYVESNVGGTARTEIGRIDIKGELSGELRDVSELKPC